MKNVMIQTIVRHKFLKTIIKKKPEIGILQYVEGFENWAQKGENFKKARGLIIIKSALIQAS